MTTPHRATPANWELQEQWADPSEDDREANADCLLELRSRLAAAEQRISSLQGNSSAGLTGSAPAWSLVEVVETAMWSGEHSPDARAAILAVADAMSAHHCGAGPYVRWLREEVERG